MPVFLDSVSATEMDAVTVESLRRRLQDAIVRNRRGLLWALRRNLVSFVLVLLSVWLPSLVFLRACVNSQTVIINVIASLFRMEALQNLSGIRYAINY